MRPPPYDRNAVRRTVSLTLNGDLYAKAKEAGLNVSRVAETALAQALAEQAAMALREELRRDMAAIEAYEAEHGSFAAMAREHYADEEADASV